MKTNKILFGVLMVVVVFTSVSLTFPFSNIDGLLGWDCYGYICTLEPICAPQPFWECTNYCQQVPWGYWSCLGISSCTTFCD